MLRLIKRTNKRLHIRLYWFDSVDSTSEVLKQMALKGEAEGAVVVAGSQTRGRGRMQRSWFSPEGTGLYFSLLLRPLLAADQAGIIPIFAAAACVRAIQNLCRIAAEIKWPNDLLISGKKVGGILCESHLQKSASRFMMVGVGINVNTDQQDFPAGLHRQSISLAAAIGRPVERERLLQVVLREMRRMYPMVTGNRQAILKIWQSHCRHLDHEVTIRHDRQIWSGVFKGVAENGAAIVELPTSEMVTIENGDFSLREN